MIEVILYKNGFCVSGHAEYAPIGSDIVCAGVSSLAYATIISLKKVSDKIVVRDYSENKGMLKVECDSLEDNKYVKLFLEHFYDGLKMIERQFYEYVRVEDERHEEITWF